MQTYALPSGVGVLLHDLGIDAAAITRRAGLPLDAMSRPGFRVGAEDYFALWLAMETEYEHGDVAVGAARALSAEAFDPVLFAGLCSPNLTAAAHRIADYKRLLYPVTFEIDDSSGLTLQLQSRGAFEPPPVLARFELLFWVAFARLATRERIKPVRVMVPVVPDDQIECTAFLDGCRLTRGRRAQIQFSELDARRPFVTSNEPMWNVFEPQLRRRLQDLETNATWTDRVQSVLLEALPAGRRALADVASDLNISARTLQRYLTAEGTSFRGVLGHTRERLARHYLSHTALNDTEIALLLGYDELTSLHRAFRTWTGQTIGTQREAAVWALPQRDQLRTLPLAVQTQMRRDRHDNQHT
ncbi:hypothetical protein BFN03_01990 [Rhodococcus sp. WMMA185]|uniref:AraC family transcriptional regulator n=1 Tax=Rhodococcus sp. WMMA185 TaxID=679318 RepID=UPI0008788B1D|nr:AraC family transcriptional regulator [Rhodococcus sp. WMMA185]AOW91876.1 hypothetical protein BFN03_01990 [Rhodococcus sp. WMMA185]